MELKISRFFILKLNDKEHIRFYSTRNTYIKTWLNYCSDREKDSNINEWLNKNILKKVKNIFMFVIEIYETLNSIVKNEETKRVYLLYTIWVYVQYD